MSYAIIPLINGHILDFDNAEYMEEIPVILPIATPFHDALQKELKLCE
jgi:hypothetical protein